MASNLHQSIVSIEDDENDRLLLEIALKEAKIGNPLVFATDGPSGLRLLQEAAEASKGDRRSLPCLVLLDLKLPLMNGFEVLEQLRMEPRLAILPVVIFSSSELAVDRERAKALRADEYLVKPSAFSEWTSIVKTLDRRWLVKCRSEAAGSR